MNSGFENRSLERARYAAAFSQGLRAYMQKVFGLMAAALALTGIIAFYVGNDMQLVKTLYMTPMKYVVMFAPLAVVLIMSFGQAKLSYQATHALFWLYAALVGLSLGFIFVVYTGVSIARIFFITSTTFGAMALYGYTTKRDLTSWGSFLFMGLIGVVIAGLVNIFLQSTAFQMMISAIAVIVFVGLTAYDTQNIKDVYYESESPEIAEKNAIFGALRLYLDFINLFIALLQLFGERKE
jgi:FtsH-binding integral membrane protein